MSSEIDDALARASEAEDHAALWAALAPLWPHVEKELRVARAWAEGLRATPARGTLVPEAEALLEAWPSDPIVVGTACAALIRAAERPIDEPPLSAGPAATAAGAAERCLGKLPASEKHDPSIGGRLWALRASALRLLGPARTGDAIHALERALELDPSCAEWHADLALVHKSTRNFGAMLAASNKARSLDPTRGALWNLAIAATAQGEGTLACEAWRALGIDARAQGDLPFVERLPPIEVRLPTVGAGHRLSALVPDQAVGFEIVWAQPLSPCHGVIRSPTFRDALADFGDVVLWDGAPVAVRERDGAPVACFPLLAVLAKGDERRFRFLARQQRADDIERLGRELPEDVVVVQHGERVEHVCPRCAAGEVLVRHRHLPSEEHRVAFGKVIVPGARELSPFARLLEEARRRHPGVLLAIPALYEALGETAEAGKHHKRWGEIERAFLATS